MAKRPKLPPVTVAQLEATLRHGPGDYGLFDRYSKQKPTPDAIPVLRQALHDPYHAVVKAAAVSLRKLGPTAIAATDDLLAAAAHCDAHGMPQAYVHCLEAMVAIQPDHPDLVPLVERFIALDNWVPISGSMRTLRAIGTPEALAALRRFGDYWLPRLNNAMHVRVATELLHGPDGEAGGPVRQ
ncbi:MAG: hypothetical protein QM754_01300 [Tepidisphaeraceae bacterium]